MRVLFFLSLFITLVLASKHQTSQLENSKHQPAHHDHQHDKNGGKLEEEDVVQAVQSFSVELYKKVSNSLNSPMTNVFISPLGISMGFAMLSLGAKSATYQQIVEGLKFLQTETDDDDEIHRGYERLINILNKAKGNLQEECGNALFVDSEFKLISKFENDAQAYYKADVVPINFYHEKKALKKINKYVKDKTGGKIKEMITNFNGIPVMVLVNYMLFKGEWVNIFQPEFTQLGNFSLSSHTQIEVLMMNKIGLYNRYRDYELGCELIKLPFKEGAYMLIVLPDIDTIQEVEAALTIKQIKKWKRSLINGYLQLSMPKVSIRSELNLQGPLQAMGMIDVFGPCPDFSGMTTDNNVTLTEAVHKAVLDIDEYGSEAAATTSVQLKPVSVFPQFNINRPFIIVICSEVADIILFIGRVINPLNI